jgi:NADPH:quinone reductase
MKAIRFEQYGDPTRVLAVRDYPIPEPGDEEVRVRILASPVNPSDLLFVRGLYAGVQPSFPSPAGFEGVGRVDALGPHVQGLVRGQRVVVLNSERGGNWAEYTVLPARRLIPVPDDLSDEQAASFFINPASAIAMLRHVLAIPRGEWLLQSAAGSELGRMIIKLARHDGIRTINVVRRRASVAELQQLGADAVIVSTEGSIDEQVRAIVGSQFQAPQAGRERKAPLAAPTREVSHSNPERSSGYAPEHQGVKYAIDPVMGETGTQIYQALSDDGRMLVYGSLTGEAIRVGADPRFVLTGHRNLEVFWLGFWLQTLDSAGLRNLTGEIVALMREGILGTSTATPFSLAEISAAVKQAESSGRQGKVLLVPAKQ